ncbi:MAG: dihydropteroate synthase [Chloroflexota bacterium]
MIIVGERLNPSRREIARAIEERNEGLIQREARLQIEAGASYLDISAGVFLDKEAELLMWLVKTVQAVTDKPLSIDTVSPKGAEAALKIHKGKALLNSISAQKEHWDSLTPLIKEYGCAVVALCQDDSSAPQTVEGKLRVASGLIEGLAHQGVAISDIFLDPLVHSLGVDFKSGGVFLDTLVALKKNYPEVKTIAGVSNVSYGLPKRRLLNRNFLLLSIECGLEAAILDPLDQKLLSNIFAAELILGKDEFCGNFLRAYRQGKLCD